MRYLKCFLNYKLLLFIGFLLIVILIAVSLQKYTLHYDPWILGDWLINYYDGGFKRRGLSGSLFFIIQDITNIKLANLVFTTQLILYLLFFYFYFFTLKNKKITFEYFLLLFSPFFLLFYPNDTAIIGRKEVLLFVIYVYLIYNIQNNKLTDIKEYIIIALLVIVSLMHELTFFFIPYFLISIYTHSKKRRADQLRVLMYISIILLTLMFLLIWGNKVNNGQSLSILKMRGVVFKANGILTFRKKPLEFILANIRTYYLYLFSLLYQIILLGKFLRTIPLKRRKGYIHMGIFCLIFSFPIFLLALDWGRWLHIHFVLSAITLSAELENNYEWKSSDIVSSDVTIKNLFWIVLNFSVAVKHYHVGIAVSKFIMAVY